VLDVPGWPGHRAGQHVDVRLTAEDGYQAQRSYSIASPPEGEHLELTVERLDDGEVSPYLADELREGDDLELRGPIGGWFVWEVADGGPVLLVAGGSGVVPLAAMARHRLRAGADVPMHLVLSARTRADLIYGDELQALADRDDGFGLTVTLTREDDPAWTGRRGRIDAALLGEAGWPPDASPRMFVCGPTGLVEAAAGFLVDLGHDPQAVRTERFGPTGS
jgi:ferredoxin-NADP reductase